MACVAAPADADGGERYLRLQPKHAATARDVRVRWRLHGATGAPVVIVQGGISANCHVTADAAHDGWWAEIAGPGRALDTHQFRILSIDWLERALPDALANDP